jgi:hypothetical protein
MPMPDVVSAPVDSLIAAAAAAYAARGWAVIPLHGLVEGGEQLVCTCHRGAECESPGKHPLWQGWERRWSKNPLEVAGWYSGFSKPRNVGIVCGPSGLAVIDVDSAGGERMLDHVMNGNAPERCPQALTRRGRHLYIAGADIQAAKLFGIDVKAGNGFVVAPPSVRVDGGRYRWS